MDFEVKSTPSVQFHFGMCPPRGFRDESPGSQEAETSTQLLPLPLNCATVAKWHNFSDPPFASPLKGRKCHCTRLIIFIFIIIHSPAAVTRCAHVRKTQWALQNANHSDNLRSRVLSSQTGMVAIRLAESLRSGERNPSPVCQSLLIPARPGKHLSTLIKTV